MKTPLKVYHISLHSIPDSQPSSNIQTFNLFRVGQFCAAALASTVLVSAELSVARDN
jgi:hypothetical protein